MRVEQRLLAEPVANEHEPFEPPVPERDREHAFEVLGKREPPFFVGVRDQRRIACAADLVACCEELTTELVEVVELAVEDGDDLAALVAHRLVACLQVDHREAAVAEHAAPKRLDGAVVGAAVYDRRVHGFDQPRVGRVPAKKSADPAHAREPRLRGRLVPRRETPRRRGLAAVSDAARAPAGRLRGRVADAAARSRRGLLALCRPRARSRCARTTRPSHPLDLADACPSDERRSGRGGAA